MWRLSVVLNAVTVILQETYDVIVKLTGARELLVLTTSLLCTRLLKDSISKATTELFSDYVLSLLIYLFIHRYIIENISILYFMNFQLLKNIAKYFVLAFLPVVFVEKIK